MFSSVIDSIREVVEDYKNTVKDIVKDFLVSIRNGIRDDAYRFYEQHTGETLIRDENEDVIINDDQGRNDAVDAFRHAYTSGRVTQIVFIFIPHLGLDNRRVFDSREIAEYFGNQNEIGPKNDPYERRMDLWNNEIGRRIGYGIFTKEKLARHIAQALHNGDLVTDIDDPRLKNLYPDDPRLQLPDDDNERKILTQEGVDKINDNIRQILDQHDSNSDDGTTGGAGGGAGDAADSGSGGSGRSIRRDPLVLDLDGDGIELTSLDHSQAYFDLNGDGFASRTAWLSGDDGFLALDRNGDGSINDISELFGSPQQSGYDELSDLDSNADKRIDATDQRFSDLRIWQDKNGDGVSQADELRSLSEAGIDRISLQSEEVSPEADADAQITRQGTFSWQNGTEGMVGEVLFTSDPTLTQFVGEVELHPSVQTIGNIKGYGQMPDLHLAMSLDSGLRDYVLNLFKAPTAASLLTGFDTLLAKWAGVESITIDAIDPNHGLEVNAETGQVDFRRANASFTLSQLGVIKQYAGLEVLLLGDGQWRENGQVVTTGGYYRQAYTELSRNLLVKFVVGNDLLEDLMPGLSYDPATDLLTSRRPINAPVFDELLAPFASSPNDDETITKQWLALIALVEIEPSSRSVLAESIGHFASSAADLESLLPAFENPAFELLTIAGPSIGSADADSLNGSDNRDLVMGLGGDDTLSGQSGNDILDGGVGNDRLHGGNDHDQLRGGTGDDSLHGNSGDDVLLGGTGNDTLDGGSNDDLLLGGTGDDTLDGGHGDDILDGGEGSDTLNGGSNDDQLLGGTGDDKLNGDNGDDTLVGGTGNDILDGGSGNDRYLFGLGAGQDTLNQYDRSYYASTYTDTVVFGDGISLDTLRLVKSDNDLIIHLAGSTDQLTLSQFFKHSYHQVDQFELADGTIYTTAELLATLPPVSEVGDATMGGELTGHNGIDQMFGAAGDDTLSGQGGDDTLTGKTGDDTLNGGSNDDLLLGGTGDDKLNGDYGDDTLVGGTGNDILDGGYGNDRYLFGLGAGQDTLNQYDRSYYASTYTDTVVFGDGISLDTLRLVKSDNDLIIELSGSTDQLTLSQFFKHSYHQVDQFELADGTIYTTAELLATLPPVSEVGDATMGGELTGHNGIDQMFGAAGDDTLFGQGGDDTLTGKTGDDTLNGGSNDDLLLGGTGDDKLNGDNGDDTLVGGTGNDILDGGSGNDRYLFGLGAGQDTLNQYDRSYYASTYTDTVVFGDGISLDTLRLVKSDNDLIIELSGSTDQLTLSQFFKHSHHQVDQFELADGTIYTTAELLATLPIVSEVRDTATGGELTDHNGDNGHERYVCGVDSAHSLLNHQVDQLALAMASYNVPSGAGDVIPQETKDELQPVLVEIWQTA